MPPKIGPQTRFESLAQQVKDQSRFYDRKASKHIRFTDSKGIYLHRGFDPVSLDANARAKNAAEIAAKRGNAAQHIYDTIAADLGDQAAESVFRKVKGDHFDTPEHKGADTGVTLEEFERIAQEVETIRHAMSGAVLNGVTQAAEKSATFNKDLSNRLNQSFAKIPPSPASTPHPAPPEAQFSSHMLKEMGQATYIFDGEVISSPDPEETGYPLLKDDRRDATAAAILLPKLWNLPHFREADYRLLSNALHSGMFDVFQGVAEEHAERDRNGLLFFPIDDAKGLTIRCMSDRHNPGVYIFDATLKQPLAGVANADGAQGQDRLDPAKSHLRMDIHGYIDCNNTKKPIEVGAAFFEYAGHLADETPTGETADRR